MVVHSNKQYPQFTKDNVRNLVGQNRVRTRGKRFSQPGFRMKLINRQFCRFHLKYFSDIIENHGQNNKVENFLKIMRKDEIKTEINIFCSESHKKY